jgi:tetratricopeptide (TPR) repeat protein/serine/threonine protein kinase
VSVSLRIVSDLLSAVTALHEAAGATSVSPFGGLSPDSVLVTRSGETQLCDPLVASCASLLDGIGFNTAKLAYAAPEQVNAVAPLTPASDVFTCGALLWELLAARRLLSGSRAALERKLMEHNLPSLASNLRPDQQVAPALVELVGRALSGDAAKRPATAAALQAELATCGHELASHDEVAQLVGKLSGQRFDRRSAAVRSKSVPEMEAAVQEWPVETPSGSPGPTSRRAAPRPAAATGAARAMPARPAQRSPAPVGDAALSQEDSSDPLSSQTDLNPVPSAALQSSQASTERSDEPPASTAVSATAHWLPPKGAALDARARKGPPGPPPAPSPAPSTGRGNEAGPATPGAGSSTRKDLPAFLEPPARLDASPERLSIPERFAMDDELPTETGLGLEDDGDLTVREPPPEGFLESKREAPGPATAPGVGLPDARRPMPPLAEVGGRTFVGMGAGSAKPAHPALAASTPFAHLTPDPFPAQGARAPSPFDPPATGAAGATLAGAPPPPRPFAPASSAAGATLLGMPPAALHPGALGMPPAALPPDAARAPAAASPPAPAAPARAPSPFDPPGARAPSPFDPPAAARPSSVFDPPPGARPSPFDPPGEEPVSSEPASSSPYSRTATSVAPPGSGAPGRSLPPGIGSLRGYEPKFSEAPGELLPRISPSARVMRPRSGWARALGLGSGGAGRTRTVLAGAAACVALAGAVLLVLLLRRTSAESDAELTVEPTAAAPQPTAPGETGAAAARTADAPASDIPAAADAPPAADAGAPQADAEPAVAPAATALSGLNAPQLSDAQLSQLFALEQREDVPSCPERAAPAGKAAKAKKTTAKDSKEAARLLKVARTELKRKKANVEKAHGLLCRATGHDPANWQAQQALAEVSLQLGNAAQAQAAAEKALARKPEDVTLLGLLGDAQALTGDLPGSRQSWLRGARGQGPEPERMRALAGTYRKLADRVARGSSYPLACALYRRALVLTEGSYAPSIGLAEALRALRQPRAALAWAERAAQAFPKDARVQLLYGDILYDNGQKQEAKAAWKAARKAQPNNALAARRLARGKP